MRIALASIHPRPLSGQIEGLVGLAHALQERGHAVKVVSAFPDSTLLGESRIRLEGESQMTLATAPFRMLDILSNLVRAASTVDVIQLNLPTPAFSFVADFLTRLVAIPVVVGFEAHLVNPPDLLRLDRLRQAPAFYLPRLVINNRLVARMSTHRAARYVVSSKFQSDELIALGVDPGHIRRLPNVLPADKLQRSGQDLRATLPPGRLISYVGHYNHIKGVDVLLQAFQELAPRVPDARLVLAWSGLGGAQKIQELQRAPGLEGRVLQIGKVNVPDLFAASDVVALPYRLTIGQAAYPATLLEALAANIPVVTSDLPLLRELTGERTALLAKPEDPSSLARAIERLLTDQALANKMREAQRQWRRQIQPQSVAREYERLYAQLVAREAPVFQPAGE